MLRVRQLTRTGIEPASFELEDGQCMSIQGPSGSGKSLLLRALADLDENTGQVSLDGASCGAMPATRWRRLVAYVPASSGWWADRVDVHFDDWNRIAPTVHRLDLPASCGAWSVDRLSTGERQRLALARALELNPRVLLLDEPTSGLDDAAAAAVESMIDERRTDGTGIIWVTHDKAQAARVATRHFTMAKGVLSESVS